MKQMISSRPVLMVSKDSSNPSDLISDLIMALFVQGISGFKYPFCYGLAQKARS